MPGAVIRHRGRRCWRVASVMTLAAGATLAAPALAETARVLSRDVPAGPLSRAIADAQQQTGWQVVYITADAVAKQSPGARAGLDERAALESLLAGTGLAADAINERTIRLYPRAVPSVLPGRRATAGPTMPAPPPPLPVEEIVITAAHVVRAPELPPALVAPLPLTLGLCLPAELRSARLRRRDAHRLILDPTHSPADPHSVWELGAAARASFERMAQSVFARLIVLEGCATDAPVPAGVDALLLVRLSHASVTLPVWTSSDDLPPAHGSFSASALMARRATLTFALLLSAGGDAAPLDWEVTGHGAAVRTTLVGDDNASKAVSLALRSAVAEAILDLARGEAQRAWLAAHGASAEMLP